jgi:hypothetical protein
MPKANFIGAAHVGHKIFSNYVSTVSGIMTIIGISGVVSWGISELLRSNFAAKVFLVFVYSMKTALAFALFIPIFFSWNLVYLFTFLTIDDGTLSYVNFFWDNSHPLANVFAYLVSLGFFIPFYAISVACFYSGSLTPVSGLIRALTRQSDSSIN